MPKTCKSCGGLKLHRARKHEDEIHHSSEKHIFQENMVAKQLKDVTLKLLLEENIFSDQQILCHRLIEVEDIIDSAKVVFAH